MEEGHVMINKRVAGLVLAAGMSSRMKAFKPLLMLGEKTLIEHVIDTLIESGIQEIVIVTGNRAEEVRAQLKGRKIHFIYNKDYATTSMFQSVKLGLEYLKNRCDEFFLMPGDIPLFHSHSLRSMQKALNENKCILVQPMYKDKHGHPVLFSSDCITHFLGYDGANGINGAMQTLLGTKIELTLPDEGLLMDADTQEDYADLHSYYINMNIPSPELCVDILKYYNTDPEIIKHCIAVSKLAKEFTIKLESAGHLLSIKLVEAGALLHDVARREKRHDVCGAQWIRELGYSQVADVVETHMNLPEDALVSLDERAIVYLADKLIIKNKRVTIDERFDRSINRFYGNEKAMLNLTKRMANARKLLHDIDHRLGGEII